MQVLLDPLTEFFEAIRNPQTKDRYEHRLDLFFKHIRMKGSDLRERARVFSSKAIKDPQWATISINEYMRYQKERVESREISESTLPNFTKPIKLFCEQNDINLNWKKISRRYGKGRAYADDRAPTKEEILQLLAYPDRRIKPAILLMVSSGIRVGAWDYLKWKHIQPIEHGEIVAARLVVYAGTRDEYKTFTTAEAFHSAKDWMDFRASRGEKVTPESWVLRDKWDSTLTNARGLVSFPKQLKAVGVARLMERALWAQGVRKPLEKGKKRHEFQADHGFRKFFNTVCDKHMKTLYVEFLLGHNTGLKESYNRAQESELLAEYLKAAPDLTMLDGGKSATAAASVVADLSVLKEQIEGLTGQVQDLISHGDVRFDARYPHEVSRILRDPEALISLLEEVKRLKALKTPP